MKIKTVVVCSFLAAISFYSCTKQGDVGQSSLLNLVTEPAGPNCLFGGTKVVSGVDANRNGVLEDNEIQNVKYVCNGTADKQVIIYFPANGSYSTTSAGGYIDTVEVLRDFNIANYADADSISFSAYLQSSDSAVTCTVNLYDMTNNVPVNNTTLTSTSNSILPEFKETSVNFLHDLPQAPIKLGVQIKSGQEGTVVNYSLPMITIYRQ